MAVSGQGAMAVSRQGPVAVSGQGSAVPATSHPETWSCTWIILMSGTTLERPLKQRRERKCETLGPGRLRQKNLHEALPLKQCNSEAREAAQ